MQTQTLVANLIAAILFFGFFLVCLQTVANLESRFGAFCTPAIIAGGLGAMCLGFMAWCLINCTRQA